MNIYDIYYLIHIIKKRSWLKLAFFLKNLILSIKIKTIYKKIIFIYFIISYSLVA